MSGDAFKMKLIPTVKVVFKLEEFSLTIVNDYNLFQGIQLFSKGISVETRLFDGSNKYNPKTMEVDVEQENLGVWVVERKGSTNEILHSPLFQ